MKGKMSVTKQNFWWRLQRNKTFEVDIYNKAKSLSQYLLLRKELTLCSENAEKWTLFFKRTAKRFIRTEVTRASLEPNIEVSPRNIICFPQAATFPLIWNLICVHCPNPDQKGGTNVPSAVRNPAASFHNDALLIAISQIWALSSAWPT